MLGLQYEVEILSARESVQFFYDFYIILFILYQQESALPLKILIVSLKGRA